MDPVSFSHRYLHDWFGVEVRQELDLPIAPPDHEQHVYAFGACGSCPDFPTVYSYLKPPEEVYGGYKPSAQMHGLYQTEMREQHAENFGAQGYHQSSEAMPSYHDPYAEEFSANSSQRWYKLEEIQDADQKYLEILRWSARVSAENQEIFEDHSNYQIRAPSFQEFVQRCPPPPPQREPTWQDYADDQSMYSQHDVGINGPTGLVWDIEYSDIMAEQPDRNVACNMAYAEHVSQVRANPRKRAIENRGSFYRAPANKRICMEPRVTTPADRQALLNVAQFLPHHARFVPEIPSGYWEDIPNHVLQMPSWEQYRHQAKDGVYCTWDSNFGGLRWFSSAPKDDYDEPQHLALSPSKSGEFRRGKPIQGCHLPGAAKESRERALPWWRKFTLLSGFQDGRKTRFHTFAGQPIEIARRRGRYVPHLQLF